MQVFIKAFVVGAFLGAASALAAPLALSDGNDDMRIAQHIE